MSKEPQLSIRALEPEKAILAQAMNAVLSDQSEFRQPSASWEAFCERIDAPTRTILALRQLFSETEPYDG